jgi:glycosyltransferase involved in cell wall biosynthesis
MQGRSLPVRVLGRLIKPINVALYNKEILHTVEQFDAKVFLTVKGSYINVATLKALSARGVETINYYPDFRFSYAGVNQYCFNHYSAFITTKSFHIKTLEKILGKDKVHFLHHGYCADVHYPPAENLLNAGEVPDVLYVGTYTEHKEQLFTQLKQNSPGLRLMIFGHGWSAAKSNMTLKSSLANRPVVGRNYAQLIHAAKINLAIHMGPADDTGWQDLVSTRSFEIPACKGFMLHIDNAEIRTLYDVGQEIDVFSDALELSEKIDFYLQQPFLRQQMVENAYQRCVPAYSYEQRSKEIAQIIAAKGS